MLRNYLFIASLLFGFYGSIGAQSKVIFSDLDWLEVMDRAQAEDKLIFLDAYTSWCQACKEMDRTTFNSVRLANALNKDFISVKMNMEEGQGPVLGFRYGIQIYPSFVFFTSAGTEIIGTNGYKNVDQMISLLMSAKNVDRQFKAMTERYESEDRHPDFLYNYLMELRSREDGHSTQVLQDYFEASQDWAEPRTMDLIIAETDGVDSPYFDFIVSHRDAFNKRYTHSFITDKLELWTEEAVYTQNVLSILEAESLLKRVYLQDGQDRADAYVIKRHLTEGKLDAFADRVIQYVDRIDTRDPDVLNDFAWQFYEHVDNKQDLETALGWAQQSVKLQNSYYNNDTLAALYYKLGNKRKAKKHAKKAIKLAKKVDQEVPGTKELLAKIKAM